MGIDINKAKDKVKNARATNTKSGSKPKLKHNEKMDYINSGITVVNSLAELTNTILNSKEETRRAKIDADSRQAELNSDLAKMRIDLSEKTEKMKMKLERARLNQQEKLKEIDAEIHKVEQTEMTKREMLKYDHEQRMEVLGMQREMLNTIMAIYKKYYEDLFSGNSTLIIPGDIGQQMQQCIRTINTALQPVALSHKEIYLEIED
ncbi:hypothetical protein [Lysinibacillus varians]|uniref:DUF3450 domain-containing protein n=1 Tax=Lysinibacillus varians TaxID=1145276 RepID=A0ABY2TCK1_9BACI|nr:hypothetical protein [Lysinibacillus varians]AHN24400.1 hypothetical protein T479_16900 [Lysinibacillus varians]TKI65992.1 hypothetical protein FC752_05355 [Lysinibacillus varians]